MPFSAFGMAVSAVVISNNGISIICKKLGDVFIPRTVFAKSVH